MNTQPSFAVLRLAAALLLMLTLGGCASLTESQCRDAAWSDIGFRDGRNGKVADRIADHTAACREYGIDPDRSAYFQGRDEGLVQYCTRHNGFVVGSADESYEGVCASLDEQEFLVGFNKGQELHRARSRLDDVESEIARVDEQRAKKDLGEADRAALVERRIGLERERTEADTEVARLEQESRGL